jgi:hypothetical protein
MLLEIVCWILFFGKYLLLLLCAPLYCLVRTCTRTLAQERSRTRPEEEDASSDRKHANAFEQPLLHEEDGAPDFIADNHHMIRITELSTAASGHESCGALCIAQVDEWYTLTPVQRLRMRISSTYLFIVFCVFLVFHFNVVL